MEPSGRKRDVVRHAFGVRYRDLRGAVIAIDLIERRTRDAAGEQASGLVDAEPVYAMKRRAGYKSPDLVGLCRSAGAKKYRRRDSRTQCKPARHDAISRFLCPGSIRLQCWFGKRKWSRH